MPLDDEFDALVPRVYRFALRLAGDPHRAEDLTQEALLRAWRHRRRLRDARKLHVWLFRIVTNLWRDELRRGKRSASPTRLYCDLKDGRANSPVEQAANRDDVVRTLEALESLPPRQREVLHLIAVENLTLAETSDVLGITLNAAKVSLCLARARMRELFSESNRPVK